VLQYGNEVRKLRIPRFVVVAFTDAWGGGWIRVNGDLQRVPRESHFIPRLVHLRNPAMPWAGIVDEAEWKAFWEAAGCPDSLTLSLKDLVPNQDFPWLGKNRREFAKHVNKCTLRQHGYTTYTYEERAVVRIVNRARAFKKTKTFFNIANQSDRGEILYLTRD
jgi:hypothetical protein